MNLGKKCAHKPRIVTLVWLIFVLHTKLQSLEGMHLPCLTQSVIYGDADTKRPTELSCNPQLIWIKALTSRLLTAYIYSW